MGENVKCWNEQNVFLMADFNVFSTTPFDLLFGVDHQKMDSISISS